MVNNQVNNQSNGQVKLGFGVAPRPEYVYCNRSKPNCLWYFFRDEKVIPIEEPALTGYVTGVDVVSVERYQNDADKLRIRVQADRQYVLESGAHTAFAKGFLGAWNAMSDAQRAGAITIEVSPADKPTVLFCSVYDEMGALIIPSKVAEPVNLPQRVKALIAKVNPNVPALKEFCKAAGLPETAAGYTHEDQVLLLRGILFQNWADVQRKDTVGLTGLLSSLDAVGDAEAWERWKEAVLKCPELVEAPVV